MKRWTAMLAVSVVATGVLAGCGTSASPGSQKTNPSNAGSASTKTIKLGFDVSTLNNPFFVDMANAVKHEAKKLGVEVTVLNGNNDPATQLNQVEDLIQQHVDAIILNPTDSVSLATAVEQANRAHIPVITLDRNVTGGNVACYIGTNNVQAGELAGQEIIKALHGKGEVVDLQGIIGTSAEADREKGFDTAIEKAPGIRVVARQTANFDRSQALNVMQNILQAHPNIQAVFAQNDQMALGALTAIQSAGKKNIKIVSIDGSEEVVKDVHEGLIYADIAQHPVEDGILGVEYSVKLLKGEKIPKEKIIPVQVIEKNTPFTGF